MKKLIHFAFAAASALLLAACAKTDEQQAPKGHVVTLSASIEEDKETKAIIGDDGSFKWRAYDKISVWTSDGKLTDFTITDGVNTATATFEATLAEGVDVAGPAIYPARSGHSYNSESNTITYDQPVKYDLNVGETKSQMAAKYDEETKNFVFKHLGGLIRYTIYNPPSDAKRVRLAYSNISGKYSVNMNADVPQISREAVSNPNSRLDIGFPTSYSYAVGKCLVFDFPLPADTYENLTFQLADNTPAVLGGYDKVIKNKRLLRKDMIRMPEVTFNAVLLADNEDEVVRENFNKVNYESGAYTGVLDTDATLSVIDNPTKTVTNASGKVLQVTASSTGDESGVIDILTKDALYSSGYKTDTKAFTVKVLYSNSSDKTQYYPRAVCKSTQTEFGLPDRINGESFDGTPAEWNRLMKADDWNVLQWTLNTSGVYRIDIKPFLKNDGTNQTSNSDRIMYFDDFRFLK